jgi:AI-2 transport protein TqsA
MSQLSDDIRRDWGVQTFCLLTLAIIAIGAALYFLRPVLVPFVLAVFLTNCLIPLIDVQTRYLRVPRGIAIASTVLLALVAVTICGSVVATSISGVSPRLKDYEKQFQRFTEDATEAAPLKRFGINVDVEEMGRFFSVQEGTGWQFMSAVLGEAANVLSSGVVVMIFMIFLLLSGRAGGRRPSGLLGEIEASVQNYLVTTVFLSIGVGVLVGTVLTVLGVEFAWVFGFLAFLLNFVPNIGPIIATLLPLPVILLNPEMSITAKVLAMAIPAVIHFVVGNLIQPRVQGNALALHPAVVLLSLMFFGLIWGISGAFLAAPMTAVVRIICDRIPATRPLANLLAGNLTFLSVDQNQVGGTKRIDLA